MVRGPYSVLFRRIPGPAHSVLSIAILGYVTQDFANDELLVFLIVCPVLLGQRGFFMV